MRQGQQPAGSDLYSANSATIKSSNGQGQQPAGSVPFHSDCEEAAGLQVSQPRAEGLKVSQPSDPWTLVSRKGRRSHNPTSESVGCGRASSQLVLFKSANSAIKSVGCGRASSQLVLFKSANSAIKSSNGQGQQPAGSVPSSSGQGQQPADSAPSFPKKSVRESVRYAFNSYHLISNLILSFFQAKRYNAHFCGGHPERLFRNHFPGTLRSFPRGCSCSSQGSHQVKL